MQIMLTILPKHSWTNIRVSSNIPINNSHDAEQDILVDAKDIR